MKKFKYLSIFMLLLFSNTAFNNVHAKEIEDEETISVGTSNNNLVSIQYGLTDMGKSNEISTNPPATQNQDFESGFPDNPDNPDAPLSDVFIWTLMLSAIALGSFRLQKATENGRF